MLEVGSAYGQITIDTRGAHSNVLGLNSLLGGLGNTFLTLNPLTIGLAAAFGTVAGAAYGLSAAISSSVDLAADLEEQLDGIQALSVASAAEMGQLQATIEELGLNPNLKVSALEAAEAVEMLVRNGLELEEIMAGAAEGTVLLANATGAQFGRAADIATDVMSLFGIEAENMIEAVNGITSVVTNSKFDINDYALAIAQGGGVAAATGVSFMDFNATIAAIAPFFSSGSDAGTSFKVFLQRLIPQSKKAAGVMQELGIITEDGNNRFFDANGNMKSMAEIAGILNTALSGLSDAQRNQALSTIFGTDAMRAAAALAQMTARDFVDLQIAMGETDAVEAARIRMDNYRGDLEILGGVIETLKWRIGNEWIPVLREMVQWFTELATTHGDRVVQFFTDLAGIAEQAIPYLQNFANQGLGYLASVWDSVMAGFETGGIAGALAAIGSELAMVWEQYIWPTLSQWASDFWTWITGDSGVEAGMSDTLNGLLERIGTFLEENWPQIGESLTSWSENFWQWAEDATAEIGRVMGQLMSEMSAWAQSEEAQAHFDRIGEQFGTILWDTLEMTVSNTARATEVMTTLAGTLSSAALEAMPGFDAIGQGLMSGLLEGATESAGVEVEAGILEGLADGLADVVTPLGPISNVVELFGELKEQLGLTSESGQQQVETLNEINSKLEGRAVFTVDADSLRESGFITVEDFKNVYP